MKTLKHNLDGIETADRPLFIALETLYENQEYELLIKQSIKLKRKYKKLIWLDYLLQVGFYKTKEFEESIRYGEKVVKAWPEFERSSYILFQCLSRSMRIEDGFAEVYRFISSNPSEKIEDYRIALREIMKTFEEVSEEQLAKFIGKRGALKLKKFRSLVNEPNAQNDRDHPPQSISFTFL